MRLKIDPRPHILTFQVNLQHLVDIDGPYGMPFSRTGITLSNLRGLYLSLMGHVTKRVPLLQPELHLNIIANPKML